MKNKIMLALTSIALVTALAACSSSANETGHATSSVSMSPQVYDTRDMAFEEYEIAEEAAEAPAMPGSSVMLGGGEATPISANSSSRMVVRTVNLTMQTMEFDAGVEAIGEIVDGYGGFMQDSYVQGKSMYDKYGTRNANFTVRIPTEKLDAFLNDISGKFNITDKRQSGNDITDTYFDTDARLKSLKTQEERLLAMLEQAGELQYLLQVEKELANVRYEIESLTSSLLRMQNQVSMSTAYLYLEEVVEYTPVEPPATTFGEKLSQAIKGSLDSFKTFIEWLVLALIWMLPFIMLIALIVAVIIAISVSAGRRSKKKLAALKGGPSPSDTQKDDGKDNDDKI